MKMNKLPQIVIDTCIFISALLSRRGASFNLLKRLGTGEFEINLSAPLCFEYESITKRITLKISKESKILLE
ncbi:PIN domain-containing protein [Thiotrichales bacterium HSG14]|nr:PIN domain-containing protein [Thiotrichales bacterium HSG14]